MRHNWLLFTVLTVILNFFAFDAHSQSYEIECLNVEQDGSQTLRVWGEGRNKVDAVEQAKKNAVNEILFHGVLKGNKGYNQRPIVTVANARERYQEYFDSFFMDKGEYTNYVSMKDRRIGSTVKILGSTQVKCCITVRVLCPQLKAKLKADGIIK